VTEKGGIYYFAKSLRKYNTTCKIVILCEKENLFKELENFCNDYEIYLYSDFTLHYEMMYCRFEIYYQILKQHFLCDINKVFFSDVDDVIFQGDPFSIEFSEDIYCAMEQNTITEEDNGSSNINRYWINESFGTVQFHNENFENQYVACAGTILGSFAGIMRFLQFYVEVQNKKIVNDQGLFNIYVYNHIDYPNRKVVPYKESRILTLDRILFENLRICDNFDSTSRIVNDLGEPYIIIHQINRCNLEFMKGLVEN
jgi:hypothetical protein